MGVNSVYNMNMFNQNYLQGPQKPGDPQPHLNGGAGGPQKPGDPQPHLKGTNANQTQQNDIFSNMYQILQMMGQLKGQDGPQNPGDPQPHLNIGAGGPQKPGDPQPHLFGDLQNNPFGNAGIQNSNNQNKLFALG